VGNCPTVIFVWGQAPGKELYMGEGFVVEADYQGYEPFPVWWTVKMEKKQNETEDILRYLT
jgi:hypothetical protein